jgi:hypothetical protein
MLMASVTILMCIIAVIAGGSLRNLVQIPIRWTVLVFTSLAIQIVIFTPLSRFLGNASWIQPLYILSMWMLVIWVALNWRIPGMPLLALGLFSNTIAIAFNNGYMPVDSQALVIAGQLGRYSADGISNNSMIATESSRLWLLSDILPVPQGWPFADVYSIGDLLLVLGGGMFAFYGIRQTPAGLPQTVTSPSKQSSSH